MSHIRTAYLGRPVRIGRYDRIESYFVSNTRMLPRDLVALLLQLQKIHPGNHQVSEVTAKRAVRAYSENYFVPEIVNNLSRVVEAVDGASIANFVDALQVMPSREFMVGDLESEIDGALDRAQLRALLKQMFEIGALGTRATGVTGANTNFKYRRAEGGGFSINHTFVLHNALVEAWNINR